MVEIFKAFCETVTSIFCTSQGQIGILCMGICIYTIVVGSKDKKVKA